MAAANRVAADNPLHDQTAAPADGGLFPRITHPYPCGGCAAFHDDESGFCAQCSRRRLVPPHTVAMLARAQRRFYLALLTLIMSMFETSDKVIIATFTAFALKFGGKPGWSGVRIFKAAILKWHDRAGCSDCTL